jgi:tetratricopeptide (TPR) repeat protein
MEVFMRRKSIRPGENSYRSKLLRKATLSLLALCFISASFISGQNALAAPTFQEGMAEYNSGKYAHALSTFQTFKASYPNNALVHYYIALCQQGLGHVDQAKAEYKWVMDSRDPSLAGKAAAGLSQLANVRTSGSGGGSSAAVMPTASAPGRSGGDKAPQGKVKKVIDFWATW